MLFRGVLTVLLSVLLTATAFSQEIWSFTDSHREVNPGVDGCANPPLCNSRSFNGFDAGDENGPFKEGHYALLQNGNYPEFMNFRFVLPAGYDVNRVEPYPMIIMLHGAGEGGRLWSGNFNFGPADVGYDNNGKNITHGGTQHRDAVNRNPLLANSFPGIVVWPQSSYNGAWDAGWQGGVHGATGQMVAKIIEKFTEVMNADPDRVAIHGLSNGAVGVWDMATKRPDLFSAVLPMSGVGNSLGPQSQVVVTTPLWLFQGGTDTNPREQAAHDWIDAITALGGRPKLTVYPTLGHSIWNNAYADAQFFPFIKAQSIKNIYVFGGIANVCPGGSLRLGFTANFLSYTWYKDGIEITTDPVDGNAYDRYMNITDPGVYTVTYQRQNGQFADSNPLTVGVGSGADYTPVLTNTGSTFLTIDLNGGGGIDNRIVFTAPLGFSSYQWYRNGVLAATTASNTRTISQNAGASGDAGNYSVRVQLASGCLSSESNIIPVYWTASQPTTPKPGFVGGGITAPSMTTVSPTSIRIDWPAYSGETGFEIWRIGFGGSNPAYNFQNWALVTVLPIDATTFLDETVRPNATYRYVVRALRTNNAVFSNEPFTAPTSPSDVIPPVAPTGLVASAIGEQAFTLSWNPTTDNDKVYRYEVYNGSTLVTTLTGAAEGNTLPLTTASYTSASTPINIMPNTTYIMSVRAIDYTGNISAFSAPLNVTTVDYLNTTAGNSLEYRLYHVTAGQALNAFNYDTQPNGMGFSGFGNGGAVSFGSYANLTLTGSTQPTNTQPYIAAYEGLLDIQAVGTYNFRTSLGNNLNNAAMLLIDNDGTGYKTIINQTTINGTATGSATFAAIGKYPIRIIYKKGTINNGTVSFALAWTTPSNGSYVNVPVARLYRLERTYFYLRPGFTDPSSLLSWTSQFNNLAGGTPANFTNNKITYVVTANATVPVGGWTVSGTGSRVVVGNGSSTAVALTLNGPLAGVVEANKNATINVGHATMPTFGVLDRTSIVNFLPAAGAVTIPNALYGDVNLNNPGVYTLPLNNTFVRGNLAAVAGATTTGAASNMSVLNIGGDITFANTSNPLPATQTNQYTLNFTGSTTHTLGLGNVAGGTDLNLFALNTGADDIVNITNAGTHTYTFGSPQGGGLSVNGTLNVGANNLVVSGRGTINSGVETGSIALAGGNLTLNSTATANSNIKLHEVDNNVNDLTITIPATSTTAFQSTANVKNLVTLTGGKLDGGEGFLTLVSDVTGTARIAPLTGTSRINGEITAQRFMEGEGRIYRYISSPVKQVTAEELQAFFPITGNFTGASVIPGNVSTASMFSYNAPTQTYAQFPAVGGTNQDTLRWGVGYAAYIREDIQPTTWTVRGAVNQGTKVYAISGTTGPDTGWNLLGNPYPAPIVWTGSSTGGWAMTGVTTTARIRENFGTQFAWRDLLPGQGSKIAPGQAFWVQGATASPTLSVSEAAKSTTDGAFYREGGLENVISIKMKQGTLWDQAYVMFRREGTPAYEKEYDAIKQANSFFNLSSLTSDTKAVSVNVTTVGNCTQEISFRTTNAPNGSYTLDITGSDSMTGGETVTFKDAFTNQTIVLTGDYTHTFSITADAASKADGRFKLKVVKPGVDLNKTLASEPACNTESPAVLVQNSQSGVDYTVFYNGTAISEHAVGNGTVLSIPVDPKKLGIGKYEVGVKAGFLGCSQELMPATVLVRRDTINVPTISMNNGVLRASLDDVQYQWYQNDEIISGATSKEYKPEGYGTFKVSVKTLSCDVSSEIYGRAPLNLNITGSSSPVCNSDALITLDYSQATALYTAYYDDVAVSASAPGTGGSVVLTLNRNLIGSGQKDITIVANFPGDVSSELMSTVKIDRNVVEEPTVLMESNTLTSSTEGASYQWFFNGTAINGATNKQTTAVNEGNYSVTVSSGTCAATSTPVNYIIMAVEDDPNFVSYSPNPTKGKVIVTAGTPISAANVLIMTTIGQAMSTQAKQLSERSVEVDFADLAPGLYLMKVREKTYRVVKE